MIANRFEHSASCGHQSTIKYLNARNKAETKRQQQQKKNITLIELAHKYIGESSENMALD